MRQQEELEQQRLCLAEQQRERERQQRLREEEDKMNENTKRTSEILKLLSLKSAMGSNSGVPHQILKNKK